MLVSSVKNLKVMDKLLKIDIPEDFYKQLEVYIDKMSEEDYFYGNTLFRMSIKDFLIIVRSSRSIDIKYNYGTYKKEPNYYYEYHHIKTKFYIETPILSGLIKFADSLLKDRKKDIIYKNINALKKDFKKMDNVFLKTLYFGNAAVISEAFNYIFDSDLDYNEIDKNDMLNNSIVKVKEFGKKRIGLVKDTFNSYSGSFNFRVIVDEIGGKYYDYIDEGNKISYCDIIYQLPEDADYNVNYIIEQYYMHSGEFIEKVVFLSDLQIKNMKRSVDKRTALSKNSKKKNRVAEKKIVKKMKGGSVIKVNDMTFTCNSVTYNDQVISHKYVDFSNLFTNRKLSEINFDFVLGSFISNVEESFVVKKEEFDDITIGQIKIDLRLSNDLQRYLINGVRINKEEIGDVLEHALCYTNEEDYHSFLKSISSCSLKIHEFLYSGLNIKIEKEDFIFKFKIPLLRKKNIQYLEINDKLYRVKNTSRLLRVTRVEDIDEVINILTNSDIIKDLSYEELNYVLEAGEMLYKEEIKKSVDLLNKTEKILGLTKTTTAEGPGYIVDGKLRSYFVEADLEKIGNCRVYSYPEMKYICIIDKTPDQQTGVDNIVNRLYALKNDSVLVNQISTLNY